MSKEKNKPKSYTADAKFPSIEHRRNAIKKYADLIVQGMATKDIVEMLEAEYDFTFEQGIDFITQCKNEIAEMTATDYSQIVAIHTDLYELLYRKFQGLDFVPGQLSAMKQKEKIMGMLEEEDNEIIINNQTNIALQNTVYDMSKLTTEQQQRFNQLFKKLENGQRKNQQ